MPSIRVPSLFALLAATLFSAAPIRAAEAYLCDDNRLVYVEAGDLERMIRSDPCIARYHGGPPRGAASESASGSEPPLVRLSEPLAAEVPLAPAVAGTQIAAADAAIAVSQRSPGRQRRLVGAKRAPEPVRAAPGTDYTNVRVINASEEGGRWFRLAR